MENILTPSLQRYLYYNTYTSKTWNIKIATSSLQIYMSTLTPIQVKPKTTTSWIPSHSLLQPYMKYFYKLIINYVIDYNHSINPSNIRGRVIGYILSLKRKQRMKLKAYSPTENKYHFMFNNMLSSDSDLLRSNTHKECHVLTANEYNYKIKECDWTRRWI